MDPAQTAAGFQSTLWSMVIRAQQDRDHLERLLRLYWSPIYGFIRRQGYARSDASDLTQEFMTRVVLKRELLAKADPRRGRFRSFLKSALRNFLIDEHRAGRYSKVASSLSAPRPPADSTRSPVHSGGDAADIDPKTKNLVADDFDRQWAAALVEQTLRVVEEQCVQEQMLDHWRVFDLNVLGPSLRKSRPIPLTQIADRIPGYTEDQLSNMIQTMKRRFRRALREVVRETVSDEAEVEQELLDLRTHLGHR